jgi:DNA-binding NarL/FixJ family response regulator
MMLAAHKSMKRLRVLLGDDHALILDGIRAALQPHYDIVGQARDGKEIVEIAERLRPDLVILDISMPILNGLESAKRIKHLLPATRLIFLSQHLNPAYLKQALRAGASGYVLKSGATEELQTAIATVLRGDTYITPSFGEDAIARLWNRSGEVNKQSEELTDRQKEILQLIVEGRANKEIAHVLHLSIKTIEFHRARLMNKLGVHTVAELTKAAIQQGLIPE